MKKPSNISIISLLGKGSFSQVSLHKLHDKLIACKSIKLPLKVNLESILDEISILKQCNHPNILQIHSIYMPSFQMLNLNLQYIEGHTLDKVPQDKLGQDILFYWIFQICQALCYLHENHIVHRDIKPANIMCNKKGLLKILDFGLSKITVNHHSDIIGTPYYVAPQIFKHNRVCDKSDIWSLGVMVYQLIQKDYPFSSDIVLNSRRKQLHENNQKKNKDIILQQYFTSVLTQTVKFSTKFSTQMKDFLTLMLQKDYRKRYSAKQLLGHHTMYNRRQKFLQIYVSSLPEVVDKNLKYY